MKLLIETQCMAFSGTVWKAKGGDSYFVMNVEPGTEEQVMESVRNQVEFSNPIAQEYIIGYSLVEDDYMTRDERLQLEFDGKILYPTRVLQENNTVE